MKSIFVALALLLAGCSAPGADLDEGDPASEAVEPELPAAFTKTHEPSSANVQLGVGGVVLSHEFDLATNSTLHYFVAWDLPEPSVELAVMKDGETVDGETLTAQEPGRLDRSVDLEPGAYTVSARLGGLGALKMFEMGGHFE